MAAAPEGVDVRTARTHSLYAERTRRFASFQLVAIMSISPVSKLQRWFIVHWAVVFANWVGVTAMAGRLCFWRGGLMLAGCCEAGPEHWRSG
jgi:hypothetical protein